MKIKRILPLLLCLLLLCACAPKSEPQSTPDTAKLQILASTYPIYLLLSEVSRGSQGVEISLLIDQKVSCLHDYSLSVSNMKMLERTDLLFYNDLGLDNFAAELARAETLISLAPLSLTGQEGEPDPHYWLNPLLATEMLDRISGELSRCDPENAALYAENAKAARAQLGSNYASWLAQLLPLENRKLITFHDGFSHFAEAFDLEILLAIEEEEGQEASAKLLAQAISLIQEQQLPAIFTELLSADQSAQAIARESGVSVFPLSLMMSGETENAGLSTYLDLMQQNVDTIAEALS